MSIKKIILTSAAALMIAVMLLSSALAEGFSKDLDAIERAADSVLMLEVYDRRGNCISTGSGFVAFNSNTLITNYHVIENAYSVIAISDDGVKYSLGDVLASDRKLDIAVMNFSGPTDLIPLPLSSNDDLKRAATVVAIGSPKGITNTVSIGNISAVYAENGVRWIQFTAPISNGSSGGALFNEAGEVIGITSAYIVDAQNVNLAIDIREAKELCRGLNLPEYNRQDSIRYSSFYGDTRDRNAYPDSSTAAAAEQYISEGTDCFISEDYGRAYSCFLQAADMGSAEAYDWLGIMYEYGYFVDADTDTAIRLFNISAQLGDPGGMVSLFALFYNEETDRITEKEAFEWVGKAADAGDEMGLYGLGICYEEGIGTGIDPEKAAEYYMRAYEVSGKEEYLKYAEACSASLPAVSAPSETEYDAGGYILITAECNVRSGPGTEYTRVGHVSKGQTFPVLGSVKGSDNCCWYIIPYEGKERYITSSYSQQICERDEAGLVIKDEGYGRWETDGDTIHFCCEVTNTASIAVAAFRIRSYTVDRSGRQSTCIYSVLIDQTVAPGRTVFSEIFDIPCDGNVREVCLAIQQVWFSDSTYSREIREDDLEFYRWVLD